METGRGSVIHVSEKCYYKLFLLFDGISYVAGCGAEIIFGNKISSIETISAKLNCGMTVLWVFQSIRLPAAPSLGGAFIVKLFRPLKRSSERSSVSRLP